MSSTSISISCDDASASDVRLADLCKKYEIPCVFYWPIEWRSLAYDKGYAPLDLIDAIKISQDFEIGAHTVTHRHLTQLSYAEACAEISDGKWMLEALFNTKVTKFCPPRGYSNPDLTNYTLKFFSSQRLTKGEGLVHIHPNSGANGNIPWREFANQSQVEELWCHSWELDKFNLWEELEEYFENQYS